MHFQRRQARRDKVERPASAAVERSLIATEKVPTLRTGSSTPQGLRCRGLRSPPSRARARPTGSPLDIGSHPRRREGPRGCANGVIGQPWPATMASVECTGLAGSHRLPHRRRNTCWRRRCPPGPACLHRCQCPRSNRPDSSRCSLQHSHKRPWPSQWPCRRQWDTS